MYCVGNKHFFLALFLYPNSVSYSFRVFIWIKINMYTHMCVYKTICRPISLCDTLSLYQYWTEFDVDSRRQVSFKDDQRLLFMFRAYCFAVVLHADVLLVRWEKGEMKTRILICLNETNLCCDYLVRVVVSWCSCHVNWALSHLSSTVC